MQGVFRNFCTIQNLEINFRSKNKFFPGTLTFRPRPPHFSFFQHNFMSFYPIFKKKNVLKSGGTRLSDAPSTFLLCCLECCKHGTTGWDLGDFAASAISAAPGVIDRGAYQGGLYIIRVGTVRQQSLQQRTSNLRLLTRSFEWVCDTQGGQYL